MLKKKDGHIDMNTLISQCIHNPRRREDLRIWQWQHGDSCSGNRTALNRMFSLDCLERSIFNQVKWGQLQRNWRREDVLSLLRIRCRVLMKVEEIIQNVHASGVIHGELTSSNIMLNKNGTEVAIVGFEKARFVGHQARITTEMLAAHGTQQTLKTKYCTRYLYEKFVNVVDGEGPAGQ